MISVDNALYSLALNEKTMTKVFETADEFDPIISVNKVKIGDRWIALLSTLRCLMIAVDVQLGRPIGQTQVQSSINCMGCVRRSSGFSLGCTLISIGN